MSLPNYIINVKSTAEAIHGHVNESAIMLVGKHSLSCGI